jgi:hypothetical protein
MKIGTEISAIKTEERRPMRPSGHHRELWNWKLATLIKKKGEMVYRNNTATETNTC